ncbi:hypothetical protein ACFL7M_15870 [Thermodesulfobacteriota bacterium]
MPKKPTNEELVQKVRELELDETDHEKAEATPRENEELKNHMIKKKQLNSVLEISVEKGYISTEQLKKALYVQRSADRRVDKSPDLIGEILSKLGFMKNSKIKKVIKFIKKAQNS